MADLATPTDLADFPGAPFSAQIVKTAAASVQADAGWHIAPKITETIVLDSPGGRVLMLPSLKVASVATVRDLSGDTPREVTGWRLSQAGMLSLTGGWPCGFSTVEVTLTHGYETCPDDLLGLIAERCQRGTRQSGVTQESLGSRSVSYGSTGGDAVLSRYRIPALP